MLGVNNNKKLIIVANWKMNPASGQLAVNLLNAYINEVNVTKFHLIIAPPAIYLNSLKEIIVSKNIVDQIFLGAQNICFQDSGAYTGEISASMVKDSGCNYTIIGHSERRGYFQESNYEVAKKFVAAIKNNLIPIVCIGEDQKQFDQGESEVIKVLNKQIDIVLDHASSYLKLKDLKFFLAYEPMWSIGTGVAANDLYINNICNHIKSKVQSIPQGVDNIKILYGGSVNKNNCKSIFEIANIDGALIGGASLSIDQFKEVCN